MKIHEYQAKDILAKYGVAVPHGEVANTLDEALEVAKRLFSGGAKGVVVKAQIHAGGRGKGGGVKVAKTIDEAQQYAEQILGMQLVTHQTGPLGQKVQRLLIEETAAIDRELYLGIVLDRAAAKLVFMASQAGASSSRGSSSTSRSRLPSAGASWPARRSRPSAKMCWPSATAVTSPASANCLRSRKRARRR
jgi:succinyl-CoA synthetase beta subunit